MELDTLLMEVREPEPVDDGFTDRVMATVRTEGARWWRKRRFLTRPMALAAAAVLVTGGALAAVRTVSEVADEGEVAVPMETTQGAEVTVGRAPLATSSTSPTESGTVGAAAHDEGDAPAARHREGDLEWGYESEHTAYVLDHSNGLRLETETHTNDFALGEPQRVTLTLSNTGEQPIGISAPRGCALSVAAFHDDDGAEKPEDPAAFDPTGQHARGTNGTQQCAGAEGDPRTTDRSPEKFVLAPGESRTADVQLVLAEEGDWGVLGMCQCETHHGRQGDEGDGGPIPVPDLMLGIPQIDPEDVASTQLTDPTSSSQTRGNWRMFTPPIHVVVTK